MKLARFHIIAIITLLVLGCGCENRVSAQAVNRPESIIYTNPEITPAFRVGNIHEWLMKNIRYPNNMHDISARLMVGFTIDTNGKLIEPEIKTSSGSQLLDEEVLRLVLSMPNWQPGMIAGKKVAMPFLLPIQICINE